MKKFLAFILAVTCLLSLSACGGKEEAVNLDLQAVYSDMAAATDEEMIRIGQDRLLDLYGIKQEQYTEALVYSYNSGMMAAEIWLIKAASQDALAELKAMAETRLSNLDAESATYSPEMNKVVKKAQVITRGDYLAMICSTEVEALAKIFNEA